MNEEAVRQELERVLQEEPNNYGRILDLSTKLSGFDNDNIRFTVDASVIDRLGTELVARHETAVSELIKNSYDADAKSATINFHSRNRGSIPLQATFKIGSWFKAIPLDTKLFSFIVIVHIRSFTSTIVPPILFYFFLSLLLLR
jgi:hypothetical protein